MSTHIHVNEVEEEIDYLQIGQTEEHTFYGWSHEEPGISSYNTFPEYKFMSIEIYHHNDKLMIDRSTYSILECFGDIGGLIEFTYYIRYFLLLPFTKFTLSSTLLSSLFDERYYKRENKKSTL